jgi:hypothetical protein
MITKRRNWKTEKNLSQCDSVHNIHPKRTALRLNLGLISGNMVSNHLTHGMPNQKHYFYSHLQVFPSFSYAFLSSSFISFTLQPNYSLPPIRYAFLFFCFFFFFLALQRASFEPCLIKRTDVCSRTITTSQIH